MFINFDIKSKSLDLLFRGNGASSNFLRKQSFLK